jgi:hypothetical protein
MLYQFVYLILKLLDLNTIKINNLFHLPFSKSLIMLPLDTIEQVKAASFLTSKITILLLLLLRRTYSQGTSLITRPALDY